MTVSELLADHVGLDVECLDRIYLNGYVPNLQVGGQVVSFMTQHLGNPIPSPAIMEKIGTSFRRAVRVFAEAEHLPVIRFGKGDRKIEVMRRYLVAQARTGRSGVAAIGVAQEYQNVFAAHRKESPNDVPWFSFTKADRRVTCFYFYLWDADFGPAFIKICAYFPYPVKVWLNGHEWAKRQAVQAGVGFTALSNGFAACEDPASLQAICDRLGPGTIQVFFERWMSILPLPLTDHDRAAGYWWELSMRQIEVSRTLVFDAPRQARAFFEALVVDNLTIGRPESLELIFGRRIRRGRQRRTQDVFNTKVVTRDTEVTINAFYKHSRVKQYLKDGRALRVETVVNSPTDLGCLRRLVHLDELQSKGRDVNRRLLDTERVGQGCVLASPAFERVAVPTLTEDGKRGPSPTVRRPSGHGPARRPVCRSERPRVHQPEPACPGEPPARRPDHRLQRQPSQLRPGPTPSQRLDRSTPGDQHLRPDTRRATGGDLLHQGPRPAPTTAPGRGPAPSPTRDTRSPDHHRPTRPQPSHQRPIRKRCLKLKTNVGVLATKDR
jgi:hypothetical protein